MAKKYLKIAALFLLMGVLAACSTPEPTPVPTEVPTTEPEPTEAAPEADASSTAVGDKWCEDTDIVFFAGGSGPEAGIHWYIGQRGCP